MPCQSDYMEANGLEIKLSRVYCLIEELENGKSIDKSHWKGYHPRAYGKATKLILDDLVNDLCLELTDMGDEGIKYYSLELQMWWRDHQLSDKQREKTEKLQVKIEKIRKKAISKLTEEEILALNLEK